MFLDQLEANARSEGLAERIETRVGDMGELDDLADESFDLLWCEGAIYNIGFEQGLRSWRRLLVRGGGLAVSEAVWLVEDPPAEAAAYWQAEYPAITSVEENLATLERCGYRPRGHFVLPEADWWAEYYDILEHRLEEFRALWRDEPAGQSVVDDHAREIELTRRHLGTFGYVFFVGRRS